MTRVAATLMAVPLATTLATAFAGAASAAPLPPATGVAPGAVTANTSRYLFYTAADGSVQAENVTSGQTSPASAGGHIISAPAPIFPGGSLAVFGQGTDNQVWVNSCDLALSGCGSWSPLGGNITSKPGAVDVGPAGSPTYSVYARGTDGAVWARDHSVAGAWDSWHSLGGQVLPGTGPTAAYLNGSTYVMVVGTDHQLYIEQLGFTGFVPVGGQTNVSPALTAVPGTASQPAALVGFARGTGTDGASYYHRFSSTSPGWHSMAGAFISGLAATEATQAAIPATYTFGQGLNGQIYEMVASWASYPPGLGTWVPVAG